MVVLGIYDGTHDAGAAVVRDGVLVAASSEERFTRQKGQGGWPEHAIADCLARVGEVADRVGYTKSRTAEELRELIETVDPLARVQLALRLARAR